MKPLFILTIILTITSCNINTDNTINTTPTVVDTIITDSDTYYVIYTPIDNTYTLSSKNKGDIKSFVTTEAMIEFLNKPYNHIKDYK